MSEQLTIVEFRAWLKSQGILLSKLASVRFTVDSVKDASGLCVNATYENGMFRFAKITSFPGEEGYASPNIEFGDWLAFHSIPAHYASEVAFGIEKEGKGNAWLVASVYKVNSEGKMFYLRGIGKDPANGTVARQRLIVPLFARPSSE